MLVWQNGINLAILNISPKINCTILGDADNSDSIPDFKSFKNIGVKTFLKDLQFYGKKMLLLSVEV